MFTENTLRRGVLLIENYHSLDKIVEEEEVALKLGICPEGERFETFEKFCNDYNSIRRRRDYAIWLTNRQFSDHKFNFYRTIRNGALTAILGLFSDPQLHSALVLAGAGMAVTAYDEKVNKGTMQLGTVWAATALGAFIGSFFGEDQTGKYIGAGIGSVLSTAYQVQQGLKRRITPNIPKEDIFLGIQEQYQKNLDTLVRHYSS